MTKPTAMVANSAAGIPHPDDTNLRIQQVSLVDPGGIPTSGGSHVYGRTNGLITSDTWTTSAGIFVMTFTYNANGELTGTSDWVKQ